MNCKSLPEIIPLERFQGDYSRYQLFLYSIFLKEIKTGMVYQGLKITLRSYPKFEDKEDSFYHLTCKEDYGGITNDRVPDLRRCERLVWLRPTIMTDHILNCGDNCLKIYKKNKRIHLLNDKDRYIVVLEPRKEYTLLVTAFYIEKDHTLSKKMKDYEKHKIEL
jgi:hypothetical protein